MFRKTLIGAAVAAAVAAPAASFAETTLYGNFRGSIISEDVTSGGVSTDSTKGVNNASRLGVKGAIGENGLKGIYHLQMGASNDGDAAGRGLTERFYFAGLKGSFGSIVYGRTSTAYKMAGVKLDPFYDTSVGPANGGANYGLSPQTNGFTNNSLAYTSPKLGGAFTINAAVYLDDAEDQDYNIGGQYSNGGITAGLQYTQTNDVGSVIALAPTDSTAIRIYGGYKTKAFSIAASYETVDIDGTSDEQTYLYVPVTFNVSPKTKLAASFGQVDDAANGAGRDGNGDGYALGVFHNILPKTTLSAIVSSVDYDNDDSREVFGIGVVQSF
jgi:hypothetical protein